MFQNRKGTREKRKKRKKKEKETTRGNDRESDSHARLRRRAKETIGYDLSFLRHVASSPRFSFVYFVKNKETNR